MARAVLRDDVLGGSEYLRVGVGLDDDYCQPNAVIVEPDTIQPDDASPLPYMKVLHRTRIGYTDEGVPTFDWTTIIEGRAIVFETRKELDSEAGVTVVKATLVMSNPEGVEDVPETAVVFETEENRRWNVYGSRVVNDRIELSIRYVDHEITVGEGPPPSDDTPHEPQTWHGGNASTTSWDYYVGGGGA